MGKKLLFSVHREKGLAKLSLVGLCEKNVTVFEQEMISRLPNGTEVDEFVCQELCLVNKIALMAMKQIRLVNFS